MARSARTSAKKSAGKSVGKTVGKTAGKAGGRPASKSAGHSTSRSASKSSASKSSAKAGRKPPVSAKSKSKAKAAKPAVKASAKKAQAKAAQAKKPAPKHVAPARAQGNRAGSKPARSPSKAGGRSRDWAGFFSPLDDRILVVREGAADRTPGGLFIPETASASDRPASGVVVAVGRGHRDKKGRLRPLDVKIDDQVLFERWAGSELELQGEQVVVLREKDVLGVAQS